MPFYLITGIPYALINLLILWWYWHSLQGTRVAQIVTCSILLLLMLCLPIFLPLSDKSTPYIVGIRIGATWLGMFTYIFAMIVLVEIINLIFKLCKTDHWIISRYYLAIIIMGLSICISIASWINAALPVVREATLTINTQQHPELAHLNGSTRTIAALSDLHLGRTITPTRLARAIDLLEPYQPDTLLFLGDVLDDHIRVDQSAMQAAISRLQPKLGIWGILGNHEYIAGPIDESISILEQSGIRILRDQWTVLDNTILIVGRDDIAKARYDKEDRKSLDEIMATVPAAQRNLPLIVLDHEPYHLEQAENAGAVLQLSGHTHNGQLWPFNLVVQSIFENAYGHSQRGDTQYIVSAGAGTWGAPMRNTARPDVLVIHLNFIDTKKPEI